MSARDHLTPREAKRVAKLDELIASGGITLRLRQVERRAILERARKRAWARAAKQGEK